MDEIALNRLAEWLLLPPGLVLLLWLGAALLRPPRLRRALAAAGALLLYAGSIPVVSQALMASLEDTPPVNLAEAANAGAIVVLAGGRHPGSPEYGGDTVSARTLTRLRYGVWLQRRTGLPLLLSGGVVGSRPAPPEAELMARIAREELGAGEIWTETASRSTAGNARLSSTLLSDRGVRRIVLVTEAFHMPRARRVFEATGLEVLPAPTGYSYAGEMDRGPWAWVPRAAALEQTALALHEYLGRLWYLFRGWSRL